MKLLSKRVCYFAKSYKLSFVATLALFSFLIFLGGPLSSFAQNSSLMSSGLNQTSPSSIATSEGLAPPLIISGRSGQEAQEEPEQQRYSLYERPQHNFSIEYPSDWQLEERRAGVVATFSSRFETAFDPFAANFAIGVENLTAGNTLDNYTRSVVALLQSRPPGPDFNLTGGPMPTTFGGLPAQRMGFTVTAPNERGLGSESRLEGVQIWTIDNGTAYVLSFAAEQNKFSSYLPVVEHIIDTFRIMRAAG